MITEGEAAIPLETTVHAFRNQEKTKINYSNFYLFLVELKSENVKMHFKKVKLSIKIIIHC